MDFRTRGGEEMDTAASVEEETEVMEGSLLDLGYEIPALLVEVDFMYAAAGLPVCRGDACRLYGDHRWSNLRMTDVAVENPCAASVPIHSLTRCNELELAKQI